MSINSYNVDYVPKFHADDTFRVVSLANGRPIYGTSDRNWAEITLRACSRTYGAGNQVIVTRDDPRWFGAYARRGPAPKPDPKDSRVALR